MEPRAPAAKAQNRALPHFPDMANCWRLDWGDTPSSLMNHPLSGITLLGLLRFVKRHRKLIDWQQYWRRLVFITAMSMFNTCLSVVETVLYGGRIHCTYINPRVVFVLGQPRSGTMPWGRMMVRGMPSIR